MLDDLVEQQHKINSLIIVLVVLRQNPTVVLLLQPVLENVVVCLMSIATRPYLFALL